MSKFQQQMSGTWNQQVLEREKADQSLLAGTTWDSGSTADGEWDWEQSFKPAGNRRLTPPAPH